MVSLSSVAAETVVVEVADVELLPTGFFTSAAPCRKKDDCHVRKARQVAYWVASYIKVGEYHENIINIVEVFRGFHQEQHTSKPVLERVPPQTIL